MLTPKQERYCQNLEVKRMSQRAAYMDAYPNAQKMKPKTIDEAACRLAAEDKILARRAEIRAEQAEKIAQEAAWTRQDALKELKWIISAAKDEIGTRGEMSGPNVNALINAVKELDTIFQVAAQQGKGGVLEDILSAVRGINDD